MLTHIIRYELKTLLRSGWLWALAILILGFIGFASFNGYQKVAQRTEEITKAKEQLERSDAAMLKNIELIEKGEDTDLPYWRLPTEPTVVGARHPRIAAMDAQPLAIIATGQSDMYSHFMQTSTYGYNFALDNTEISNPVQLLFGTFDLAFVFVFIIPLLIIAFTFDLLSKEQELGTLRVVASQPIDVAKWILQKMLFRFVIFALLSVVFFLLFVGIFTPQAFQDLTALMLVIGQILAYELFWFVLSSVVNIKINNSSKNAMVLIGCWLLMVLIIPVVANQIGTSLYPSPSRLTMLNEIREANRDIEKQQSEILNAYLREHPELASKDGGQDYSFWHKYYASQDMLKEKIQPLIDDHQQALSDRQEVVNYLKYLSPAIIFQESFSKLAGSSAQDYNGYKDQVIAYTEKWRGHIIPLLFQGKKYSKSTHESRPVFQYTPTVYTNLLLLNIGTTILLTMIVAVMTMLLIRKKVAYFG